MDIFCPVAKSKLSQMMLDILSSEGGWRWEIVVRLSIEMANVWAIVCTKLVYHL